MRVFFDTNVLVYVFDADAPGKQATAQALLRRHTASGEILLSTQVLQEFFVTVIRKLGKPLDAQTAFETVRNFSLLPVTQVTPRMILSAIQRCGADKISFWDALMVTAAIEGGASIVYTEDLQHGRKFESVEIQNPFRARGGITQ
jgi:predicted nucleic acid-binding protein